MALVGGKRKKCFSKWLPVAGFCFGLAILLIPALVLRSQTLKYPKPPDKVNGERLYRQGCISCHGANGSGAPQSSTEFKRPDTFPDFTRCEQTTPETNMAYKAVITDGGPSRGFSQIMPAFGQQLTSGEIDDIVAYLRTFCSEKGWPRGELNLPRALITEKAFPEDEEVLLTELNASGAPGFVLHEIHEQRFGKKNQIEIDFPINATHEDHTWYGGIGDISAGLKRVMFSSLRTGSILSLQGGIHVPSGKTQHGFGTGTTTFETFASFNQLFPTNTFFQFQFGADLPHDTQKSPQSLFFYSAVGQTFAGRGRLGRMWSPMVEFLAQRDLENMAQTNWDILPEIQVTLSKRQHIRGDIGLRTPLTNRNGRDRQVVFYLLWDWADGKLTEGW